MSETFSHPTAETYGELLRRNRLNRLGGEALHAEQLKLRHERRARRQSAMVTHFNEAYGQLDNNELLRPHQKDAIDDVWQFLNQDSDELTKRGALLHAPGSGKTVFAAEVSRMLGAGSLEVDGQPVRGLFLAPERQIIRQIIGTETEHAQGFALVAPEIDVRDSYKAGAAADRPDIEVMTYNYFLRKTAADPDFGNDFDFVIADECHATLGTKTSERIRRLQEGKISIGMTGSPELAGGKHVSELWPRAIHEISLRDGVETLGILNSFILYTLRTAEEFRANPQFDDFTDSELRQLMRSEVVEHYAQRLTRLLAARGLRTMVFGFRGQESAYVRSLADSLDGETVTDRATGEDKTVTAAAIGSFQDEASNRETIDAFTKGELDTLCTVDMGSTGLDAKVDCIVLLCPTRSAKVMIQQIGRGARLRKEPTVVIHFAYDTLGTDQQITPYDVFDTTMEQGAIVAPKAKRQAILGKKAAELSGLLYDDADEKNPVPSELISLIKEADLRFERISLKRNETGRLQEGMCPISELCEATGVPSNVLRCALKIGGISTFRSPERPQVLYCNEAEAWEFIRTHLAQPGERNAKQIAEDLGVSYRWITSRLDKSRSIPRFEAGKMPPGTLSLYYPESVQAELRREAEQFTYDPASEMPLSELKERLGLVSETALVRWFEEREIEPRHKRVNRRGLPTPCYPRDAGEQAFEYFHVADMENPEQYYSIGTAFRYADCWSIRGDDRITLLRQADIDTFRFRVATHAGVYILKSDVPKLRQAAKNFTPTAASENLSKSKTLPPKLDGIEKDNWALERFTATRPLTITEFSDATNTKEAFARQAIRECRPTAKELFSIDGTAVLSVPLQLRVYDYILRARANDKKA